jgi:gluconolactonase
LYGFGASLVGVADIHAPDRSLCGRLRERSAAQHSKCRHAAATKPTRIARPIDCLPRAGDITRIRDQVRIGSGNRRAMRTLIPQSSCLRAVLAAQGGNASGRRETTATAIPGVIAAGTKVEVIKSGFSGTEGPIGMPDGSLIFTETQANRITRIDANNQTSTFLENTNGSNGLAFDSKGRLISVQTTPGKTLIGVIYPKGQEATLSDNYEGKPYGRPNDLVVDKKGGVYFSEPGPNATPGQPPPTPPLSPAVYYVAPGGRSIRIAEGIERPNGIQLSPDEKTLYVNNTNGEYVLAFDVKPDGTVGNRRNFAKYPSVATPAAGGFNSGADGLAIDSSGRLYVVSTGGIHVFSPKGDLLGTIPLSLAAQNIAFAGPDKKTLYIVGRGSAFKVRLLAEGYKGRAK